MRAVIAEDNVVWRAGVAQVLTTAHFEVLAQVSNAEDLIEAVRADPPEIAIIDVRLPPGQRDEGAHAARLLRREHPGVGVLLLSQIVEVAHARRLFKESSRGFGYLLKDRISDDPSDFVASVRRVAAGGSAIDPDVVSQLLGGARARIQGSLERLSARERQVLELMAEGRSNQGICEKLVLVPSTVETHITAIYSKLQLPPTTDDHRRVLAVIHYLDAMAEASLDL